MILKHIHKFAVALFALLLLTNEANSQSLILFQDTSGAGFTLNTSGVGTNTGANNWVSNSSYTGNTTYPNTTPQTNTVAGTINNPGGEYLHITNASSGVTNTIYDPQVASDRFAVSQSICTRGFQNVTFSFFYIAGGNAANFGEVYYRVNGGAWTRIGGPYHSQTSWRYVTFSNPAFDNVNDLQFGFRWKNGTGGPRNMSFGVDDIFVKGTVNVSASITLNPATTVCQGKNLLIRYTINPQLCTGNYIIEMLSGATPVLTWSLNNLSNTTGAFNLNIPTTVPTNGCYRFRMSRTAPPHPSVTGTASVCVSVTRCPNTIDTEQPVVTMGSEPGAGDSVCVGSVIDVPFWSTGTFNTGNGYSAWLSDSAGNFNTPGSQQMGLVPNSSTYDPTIVPSPGSVSGIVPGTPDGCNYYIQVRSTNPIVTNGTIWGPFCIKNCDIRTNNQTDLSFCIDSVNNDSESTWVGINTPPKNVSYGAGNVFDWELLDMMAFGRAYKGTGLGSFASTTSGAFTTTVPNLPNLPAGVAPGAYYARLWSSNPQLKGSVVRFTIGAPFSHQPMEIFIQPNAQGKEETAKCLGEVFNFRLYKFSPGYFTQHVKDASYTWNLYTQGSATPFFSTSSKSPAQGFIIRTPGTYEVEVIQDHFGCQVTSLKRTFSYTSVPNANLSGQQRFVCVGDTVRYTVPFLPATDYSWSFSAGAQIVDTSNNEIRAVMTAPGNYTLKLTALNLCGSDSDQVTIQAMPLPDIDAGNDTTICIGDTIQINGVSNDPVTWSPGQFLSNRFLPDPMAFPNIDMEYVATARSNFGGCENTDTMKISVAQYPTAYAGPDTVLCPDVDGIRLQATQGPWDYLWSDSITLQGHRTATPFAKPIGNTVYWLKVTDPGSSCSETDTILINVSNLKPREPKFFTFCAGDSVLVDADVDGLQVQWSNGAPDQEQWIDTTGSFVATVFDQYGCYVNNLFETEMYFPKYEPTLHDTVSMCVGEVAVLAVDSGVHRVYWDNGTDGLLREVKFDGRYLADLIDVNGCFVTDTFLVKTDEECGQWMWVPNAFTPNIDGINDTYGPTMLNIPLYTFEIFDRWGQQIWSMSKIGEEWDGTNPNGMESDAGVYTWKITYDDEENQFRLFTGSFVLLR